MSSTSRDTQQTEQNLSDVGGQGTANPDLGSQDGGLPPAGGYGTGGRDDGTHAGGGTPLHHTRVGRYVLLSRLGKGGMGEVFEAFDPELRRTVAIKVLHDRQLSGESHDTRAMRLMREAQAMARLSHPNVLTVHDVGTHDGRVFLAMAKVDGGNLRQWLKQAPRSFRQVLPVCLAMGRGLAAAHAAGLVHRDFKPDNVLLNGEGGVWVTDFGIAREASDGSEATTVPLLGEGEGEVPLTVTGAMVGTPAYMAPEQYAGRPADARSDQFSFCISVYEALAGQRPFEEGTLRRMAVTLLDTARAKEGAIVERPDLAPPPHPKVPGWVHRLLVRGLSVSPEARFPSMDALLDALSKDPSAARRKWLGGAAAVLGGVALASGVALTVAKPQEQARPCTGAPELFARSWGAPQRGMMEKAFLASGAPDAAGAFSRAAKALDAYGTEWSTMHQQACEATRVTGAQPESHLALRMACLDRRLRSVDALTAELSRADAALVARSSEAVALLRGVSGCANIEALSAPVPLPEDPAVRAKVEEVRGQVAHAQALLDAGRYPQALPIAKAAAGSARALKYRPLEAEALHVLGWAHQRLSQVEESMTTWAEAMAAATAGRHDELAVQLATDLVAGLSDDRNYYSEAHLWARQAHALLERLGGSPELEGKLSNNEGVLAYREDKFEDAAAHYGRAVALRERALGPEHLDVGKSLNNLGMVLARQNRAAEALPLYRRALAITEERLGPQHPMLANTFANLGIAEKELGHYPEALKWMERAYALRRDTLGADHPQTLRMLNDMAMVHEETGAHDKALAIHQQALEGMRKAFGPESVEAIEALRALASAEERLGREDDAMVHYREGLALQLEVLEPEDMALHTMEEDLARLLLLHRKKPHEALPMARSALTRKVSALGPEHAGTIHARTGLAMTLLALNKPDGALEEMELTARLLAPLGWSDAEAAWAYYAHAQALWKVKPAERPRALELARRAAEGFTQQGSYGTKDLEDVRRWMASRERATK
ncbi:serine/threonine protein kinase [Pyxidicoccus fallax]|uniref:Serine/threonine protein kinase n=1 Tax=Pyxidicoccus fallax TaxID=394095 RepID=A0A848LYK2_9BACT|nr:serine/threonine-protein kinase [Pyxidicoccus fallax]NMO22680.1 serine/threonine protein kinase [Pyxidicoccus fallax]NPC84744.1 serine/threonine protein kinase [Pyxidicoccus fallax]